MIYLKVQHSSNSLSSHEHAKIKVLQTSKNMFLSFSQFWGHASYWTSHSEMCGVSWSHFGLILAVFLARSFVIISAVIGWCWYEKGCNHENFKKEPLQMNSEEASYQLCDSTATSAAEDNVCDNVCSAIVVMQLLICSSKLIEGHRYRVFFLLFPP